MLRPPFRAGAALGYGHGTGTFLTLSELCPPWRRVCACAFSGVFGAASWYRAASWG
eukprot:gene12775-4450_t